MGGLVGALQQKTAAGNSSKIEYINIASLELDIKEHQEGVSNAITMIITGGNAYTTVRQVSVVSIVSHRGTVIAAKQSLISSVEIGYSINGNMMGIWIHSAEYRHYIDVTLIGKSRASYESSVQAEKPIGYTIIE